MADLNLVAVGHTKPGWLEVVMHEVANPTLSIAIAVICYGKGQPTS
jgi:hypothetical protein